MSGHEAATQPYNCAPVGPRDEPGTGQSARLKGSLGKGHGATVLLWEPWMRVSPAGLVAALLGLGQGLQQCVPQRQQHAVVKKQEQLPQRMEQLGQDIGELEHGE